MKLHVQIKVIPEQVEGGGGGGREVIPHSIRDAKLKTKLKSKRSLISLSDPRKTLQVQTVELHR